jgi:predicted AlkP superfamily pyrophosphatase or phosphodiesterase
MIHLPARRHASLQCSGGTFQAMKTTTIAHVRRSVAPFAHAAAALILAGATTAGAGAQQAPDRVTALPGQSIARPTLVVQLTIDQLRPDYLVRYAHQLTGGLGRLMRTGATFTNATHDHGATETAPGHATVWSGRHPAHTGIVTNSIGVGDAQSPALFGRVGGASPYRFRGSSLFDWIRTKDSTARALSVSRKDRGAILPLGRAKQHVYWYSGDGRFTTSRYYADTLPTWVQQFNARDFMSRYRGKEWTLLLDASAYNEPDSVRLENRGRDFVFPHRLSNETRQAGIDFEEFPWMDDVTVEMALEGVEQLGLGKGPGVDLLSVSLSTTDAVGHRYGPDSRELHDQVLRADRALGVLIDSLYKLRDSTRIVFALSSDHGVAPFPELHFAGDTSKGRAVVGPVVDSARKRLVELGVPGRALTFGTGIVILHRDELLAKKINADSVVRAMRSALLATRGVQRVDRVETLAGLAAKGDSVARRWSHSLPPDLPAVLIVTLQPYWYWYTVRSATHGQPHSYDARVPVIFAGAGVKGGRYTEVAHTVDVAPTLAALIGVQPTERIDGGVLREIIATPPRVRRPLSR